MKKFQLLLILFVCGILILHNMRFLRPWIPTRVINLDRSPGRFIMSKIQSFLYGIPIERQVAIDGDQVKFSDEYMKKYFYEPKWNKNLKDPEKAKKTKRVIACATSHLSIWEEFYEKKVPHVFIIEDDILWHPQQKQKVNEIINGLNAYDPDWQIVWLSGWLIHSSPNKESNRAFTISGHTIYHFENKDGGGGAYILSRKGLEHYVPILQDKGCNEPSDGFLWRYVDKSHAYTVHKPICHFTELINSTIIKKKA